MHLHIVPLAVTMMAGPQILTAILRVTGPRPIRPSAAYVAAIALASASITGLMMVLVKLFDHRTGFSQSGGAPSHTAKAIQIVLVVLLVYFAYRNWRNRATVTQPKWMAAMQEADSKRCFTLGLTLIALMPGDLIAMSVVAINLTSHGMSYVDAAPFLLLTWLIAALPLIAYLMFRRRALVAMPKARDWMRDNSWIVNVVMCAVFAYLVLT